MPIDFGDDVLTAHERSAANNEFTGDNLAHRDADRTRRTTQAADERDFFWGKRRHGIALTHQLMKFGYKVELAFQRIDVACGNKHVAGEQQVRSNAPYTLLAEGQLATEHESVEHG